MCMNSKFVVVMAVLAWATAVPKFESRDNKSPVEGKNRYPSEEEHFNVTELPLQDRPPRFGFPTYNSDIQGYSQSGVVPGVYGPVKLDIGGLLLGTIIGLGAFFILPKLLHVTTPYGAYKRSEDESLEPRTPISDVLAKVQESFSKYNVDSTACLQRAICNSIQSSHGKNKKSISASIDSMVENIVKNDMTKSFIEGTDWNTAVDVGESGGDCAVAFPNCPVSLDSVASAVAKYLIS